ncbi:diacylglycerol kinase [Nocardioides sp. Bht2]|uniref:diacylglycerol kinase n=1 Tax=Nocardioides sp. Bht2 TaxID=3392297 RepID=UPI0039B56CF5
MPIAGEVAVLVNPTAGKGRAAQLAPGIFARFEAAGLQVRKLVGRDGDDAEQLARAAVRDGVSALVAVGGDGLAHLATQAVAETETPLGIIPVGTGNDIARYLALPRTDLAAAVDVIVAGRTRTLDLARSGSRYFVTVLAAGFDAIVNERANAMRWPRGQMRYNLATVAELRSFEPLPYVLELDGERVETRATLVAVGNGSSFGGGLRITEGARLDDGLLDVVVIEPLSRLELIRSYPRLFDGSLTTHPAYRRYRVAKATIAAPGIVSYADGERFGALPLTVEAVPQALKVIA